MLFDLQKRSVPYDFKIQPKHVFLCVLLARTNVNVIIYEARRRYKKSKLIFYILALESLIGIKLFYQLVYVGGNILYCLDRKNATANISKLRDDSFPPLRRPFASRAYVVQIIKMLILFA